MISAAQAQLESRREIPASKPHRSNAHYANCIFSSKLSNLETCRGNKVLKGRYARRYALIETDARVASKATREP